MEMLSLMPRLNSQSVLRSIKATFETYPAALKRFQRVPAKRHLN